MTYNSKGKLNQKQTIEQHMPLVKTIASSIYKKTNFIYEIDDLIQNGVLGLLDALSKYSPQENATFETYASNRIRGTILDALRKQDHLTQDDRSLFKKIQSITINLTHQLQQKPADSLVARQCSISIDEYYSVLQKNQTLDFLSIEEETQEISTIADDDSDNPEQALSKKETLQQIVKEIKNLTTQEQQIMQLIYVEDLNANEVAEVLNLSKARISQIHSKCISTISSKLKTKQ